jgi:hypothetical protein
VPRAVASPFLAQTCKHVCNTCEQSCVICCAALYPVGMHGFMLQSMYVWGHLTDVKALRVGHKSLISHRFRLAAVSATEQFEESHSRVPSYDNLHHQCSCSLNALNNLLCRCLGAPLQTAAVEDRTAALTPLAMFPPFCAQSEWLPTVPPEAAISTRLCVGFFFADLRHHVAFC